MLDGLQTLKPAHVKIIKINNNNIIKNGDEGNAKHIERGKVFPNPIATSRMVQSIWGPRSTGRGLQALMKDQKDGYRYNFGGRVYIDPKGMSHTRKGFSAENP